MEKKINICYYIGLFCFIKNHQRNINIKHLSEVLKNCLLKSFGVNFNIRINFEYTFFKYLFSALFYSYSQHIIHSFKAPSTPTIKVTSKSSSVVQAKCSLEVWGRGAGWCPVHHRRFSNIPGLCSLIPAPTTTPFQLC